TRRRQARDRSDLVWRADLRQHPDQLHASAVRLCAILSAWDRTALDQIIGHLLGRDSLGVSPGHPGGDRYFLAGLGDLLDRSPQQDRPEQGQDRDRAARVAADDRFQPAAENPIADRQLPRCSGTGAPGAGPQARVRMRIMNVSYESSATWSHW